MSQGPCAGTLVQTVVRKDLVCETSVRQQTVHPTVGVHSEYIRSTIGVHSEYGKTYNFVTFAFSKEETAYITLFNALTLKCWVLPYSDCTPIVVRMYSECTPIVLRL
jgi:hypothetical protein